MALSVTIETVSLEDIRDLGWPTDRHLVWSFRKTLQRGAHFSPIQLNRIWQEDATWHYEIVDGFHRYEAAKAEGITALLCQVVEMEEREARYARIHACVSKPPPVTQERALRELRLAFVQDLGRPLGIQRSSMSRCWAKMVRCILARGRRRSPRSPYTP